MNLTLLYVIILVTSIASASWVLIGFLMRVSPAASRFFCLANVLAAVGICLLVFRSTTASYLHYHGGSLALLTSFAFYYYGIGKLLRPPSFSVRQVWLPLLVNVVLVAPMAPVPMSSAYLSIVFSVCGIWLSCNSFYACYQGLETLQPRKLTRVSICAPFIVAIVGMAVRALRLSWDYGQGMYSAENAANSQITLHVEPLFWWLILAYLVALNTIIQALTATRLVIEMRNLAERDFLTGCLNRRSIEKSFQVNIERNHRFNMPLSCILFDLDYFKKINDVHGHEAGDAALKHVAQVARKTIRSMDVLGRYGGEEFLVLLPETLAYGAFETAERIRHALVDNPLVFQRKVIQIRASLGVAVLRENETYESLLKRADHAMYYAKNAGRNLVHLDALDRASAPLQSGIATLKVA